MIHIPYLAATFFCVFVLVAGITVGAYGYRIYYENKFDKEVFEAAKQEYLETFEERLKARADSILLTLNEDLGKQNEKLTAEVESLKKKLEERKKK